MRMASIYIIKMKPIDKERWLLVVFSISNGPYVLISTFFTFFNINRPEDLAQAEAMA